MKTNKYVKPEITVIEIEAQQILAGGITGTDVSGSDANACIATLSLEYDDAEE
ncbi:hypothetical protein [uncultured Prevotella sp.]|uniref:hypothetical protein n=1 Tax=uncultured Prevotella sp. TaxID=159272 RepID=UPI0027E3B04E|nr:hypothetical protein [uncultured Prevotella sp.]